jgi:hypothetical protein
VVAFSVGGELIVELGIGVQEAHLVGGAEEGLRFVLAVDF